MAREMEIFVLYCPACGGRVSARLDQLGEAVGCPLCHQPFEVRPPSHLPSGLGDGSSPALTGLVAGSTDPSPAHVGSSAERTGGLGNPPSSRAPDGRLFHFQCLRCGSILEARSSQGGQPGKCPTCAAVFTVPEMDPRTGLARADADPGDDGENPTPVHAYAAAGNMAPKLIRHEDDSLEIECPRCGRQSPVAADNCPTCGLPFTMEGVSATATTAGSSQAQTAWVLALVGLPFSFCAGVGAILGVIAVFSGIAALSQRHPRKGPAIAAIALGAVDCLIAVVTLASL